MRISRQEAKAVTTAVFLTLSLTRHKSSTIKQAQYIILLETGALLTSQNSLYSVVNVNYFSCYWRKGCLPVCLQHYCLKLYANCRRQDSTVGINTVATEYPIVIFLVLINISVLMYYFFFWQLWWILVSFWNLFTGEQKLDALSGSTKLTIVHQRSIFCHH